MTIITICLEIVNVCKFVISLTYRHICGIISENMGGFLLKKAAVFLVVTAMVMLVLPWLTVSFGNGMSFMAVCVILFFAADPVCLAVSGMIAGGDVKKLWWLPVVSALLYLIGAWAFFELWETAFLLYAAAYLIIGIVSMTITAVLRKRQKNNR